MFSPPNPWLRQGGEGRSTERILCAAAQALGSKRHLRCDNLSACLYGELGGFHIVFSLV